jgi:hypothetical protein
VRSTFRRVCDDIGAWVAPAFLENRRRCLNPAAASCFFRYNKRLNSDIFGKAIGITTLSAHKVIIAVEVIVVCAITYAALSLVHAYFGREGLWAFGFAGLLCALFALYRLRK